VDIQDHTTGTAFAGAVAAALLARERHPERLGGTHFLFLVHFPEICAFETAKISLDMDRHSVNEPAADGDLYSSQAICRCLSPAVGLF